MSYSDPLFSWSQVSFRYTLLISTSWLLFPFWMWMSNLHLKLHNKTVHRLHVTRRKILHDFWCWGFRFLEAKGRKTVFSDQSVPPGGLETKAQRLCSISETWIALKRHILFFCFMCFYILGPKTNAMCTSINFLLSVKEWKTRLQLWHSDDLTKEGKKKLWSQIYYLMLRWIFTFDHWSGNTWLFSYDCTASYQSILRQSESSCITSRLVFR